MSADNGIRYHESGPLLGDIALRPLFDIVREHAERDWEKVAIWHRLGSGRQTATTYGELAARAQQFAAAFSTQAADASMLPMYVSKSADSVAAILGALGAGKAFSCLNKKLRAPQIESIIRDAGATHFLIDGPGLASLRAKFKEGWENEDVRWWLSRDAAFTKIGTKILNESAPGTVADWWDPHELAVSTATLPPLDDDPQRIGACLFTSGSTGTPKGVLISEHDLRARAVAEANLFGLTCDDILLSMLPFSFDVGLNQLLSALTVGCSLVLLDSWLPVDILGAVATHRVTGISAVPTTWQDMINADLKFDTDDLHATLRYITVSGGSLPVRFLDRIPQIARGVGVFKTYGQSFYH